MRECVRESCIRISAAEREIDSDVNGRAVVVANDGDEGRITDESVVDGRFEDGKIRDDDCESASYSDVRCEARTPCPTVNDWERSRRVR